MALGIDGVRDVAGPVKRTSILGLHQILQKVNVTDAKVQEGTPIPILRVMEPERRFPLLAERVCASLRSTPYHAHTFCEIPLSS
jgi:hypothetical protein